MATLDLGLLRKLADWSTGGFPVTSVYLDVDGRRYPRRADYLTRMEELLKGARNDEPDRERRRSVAADLDRVRRFVRDELDRSGIRGLALFSSSGAELWEDVALPRSIREGVEVGARPRLIPLEALLEGLETFCTVVVNREKARVLLTSGGGIEEVTDVLDEVPGQHDQGGWSQSRYQRHIEDHVQRHLKHVSEVLLRLAKRRPFDHLILAGSDEVVADLERELHDYLRRTVVDRAPLAMTARAADVLALSMKVEDRLHARRESEAVDRISSEVGAGTGRAVGGLEDTVAALEAGRVDTLVVLSDLSAPGGRCPSCGHLEPRPRPCPACGARMEDAPDLVEEAVESALRQRCRVETVSDAPPLAAIGGIGALLRF